MALRRSYQLPASSTTSSISTTSSTSSIRMLNVHAEKTAVPQAPAVSEERESVREVARETTTISLPSFKAVGVHVLQSIFALIRIARWKTDNMMGLDYRRTRELPYGLKVDHDLFSENMDEIIRETFGTSEEASKAVSEAKQILGTIVHAENETQPILDALKRAHDLKRQVLIGMGAIRHAAVSFNVKPKGHPDVVHTFELSAQDDTFSVSWPAHFGKGLFAAAMRAAQILRDADEDPGFNDFIAFHVAYKRIMDGEPFVEAKIGARFLGTVGFREHSQSYASLTDPGEGHLFGTTRRNRWLAGSIVHNEHLERPKGLPRSQIESYRTPEVFEFACVRLHVGDQAPTTAYVGRFPHTSRSRNFDHEFLTAANIVKAALNRFFDLGAAECKISMDDLTTSQMLKYMRALATVPRKRLQYLSAAFNINPASGSITDDAVEGGPVRLSTPLEIGRRGIQLAAQGGFDKVTFDGAADAYPSVPVIKQFSFAEALELVHEAHSVGLTTYMSAGFTFKNIKDAIYTGVDGIGLGGAQILRYMDKNTGMHGPYTEENIDRIKVEREDAEKSVRGRGALLLARLDQMHFEGSLTEDEAAIRIPLYHALLKQDVPEVERILKDEPAAAKVLAIFHDGEMPYVGRARRILRSESPVLRKGAADDATWTKFARMLQEKVAAKDEEGLQEQYREPLWTRIRAGYRKAIGDDKIGERKKYFQGEPHYALKI
ncbi:hypothetical protein BV20DRAFT_826352 [Pilatotrama ljubarskyi]|nr:hypothetical protein BV20DRAFT_826352 [Pilatotrama ljubarskyi]